MISYELNSTVIDEVQWGQTFITFIAKAKMQQNMNVITTVASFIVYSVVFLNSELC